MEEKLTISPEDLKIVIDSTLDNNDIPMIYFNGFITSLGSGDVLIILRRHDRAVAKLHVSYTVAKTLAEKLGGLIVRLESATGNTIMTTDVISAAVKPKDSDNDMGR